jgi:uncharacterized protein with HEPN domain
MSFGKLFMPSERERAVSAIKDNHPNIPWVDMAGAGNVYRHDYEDIQERFLWMTLDKHLEPLLRVVENELSDLAS